MKQYNLTEGRMLPLLAQFSVPYLIACFLQTFYGLADVFVTSLYNASPEISAVTVGSQIMHMLTVVIVGLAMGSTVLISRSVGAGDQKAVSKSIGNSVTLFIAVSLFLTGVLLLVVDPILHVLSVPKEAFSATQDYVRICFIGIPFITAYNVISSIFRGLGDTKTPMYFVAAAGVINVGLDFLLIGPLGMGAAGAALATVISQTISVILALVFLRKVSAGFRLQKTDLIPERGTLSKILSVGLPVAVQEGLIQVSFLVITAIANSRGVIISASVGIVEKFISFVFLVPSAMLSSVSAISAQNLGAGKKERADQVLKYAILVCLVFGAMISLIVEFGAEPILGMFAHSADRDEVIRLGSQYLRAYIVDCMFAGVHFCFSGYFAAQGKSQYSFIHNILSIILMRIPGAYLASVWFPKTLFPMGLAAPLGSLISILICLYFMHRMKKAICL